ncbi:MAG: substrate-binding domain-containing protein [Chitinophagaceae bacterium]|nr:substrate-binding domain-containing protein [Chitinophagaceae bacterium]MCB9044560.1 substrate-binding domain-containing protein [Chitinophagales bacterium]
MTKIALVKGMGLIWTLLLAVLIVAGCGQGNKPDQPTDTMTSGTIEVSADETFRPVIEQELKVFDSSFPDAHVNIHYKSESECVKDLLDGKVRLILVTRDLSEDEKKLALEKKIVPTSRDIAKDAVAMIVNNENKDTVFSMSEIKGILTGENMNNFTVVFDNPGSSTLRYMLDSLIPGEKLGSNVYAAKGNDSVINYVANNPKAVGFISVSYVSDFNDPEGLAFINNVRVATVYNDSLDKGFKPYQAYIAPDWYPLTRKLFYISRETYAGLGSGFVKFLSKDRGQLIFKQSRLFPTRVNIIFREAAVNQ